MYCPFCGCKNVDKARYCANCGRDLPVRPAAEPAIPASPHASSPVNSPASDSSVRTVILFGLLFLAGILGWTIAFREHQAHPQPAARSPEPGPHQIQKIPPPPPPKIVDSKREFEFSWSPVFTMGEDLFPVLFIACSNLRGASAPAEISRERIFDVIGFSLVSPEDNTRVKLSLTGGNVLKKNVEETLVLSKGQECVVFPQLAWDYQALSQVKQLYPLDIVFQVEVNGLVSDLYTRTVRLHSINDCPLRYVDDGGKVHDLSWVLAAYINESHPQIVQLRAEARRYCRGFPGYQRAEPIEVDQQVLAFWNALHRRGVKYTSTRPTSLASDRVFSQHVSLVDEILQNSQGNCVDGSILLASALMNISVDAAIILLPGHCLLGYWADREHKQPLRALETTLLGVGDLNDFRQRGIRLPEGEIENLKSELAQQSFKAAWERGSQILREHSEDFQKGKEGYLVLDIRKARQQGVAPIPSLVSTYANPW